MIGPLRNGEFCFSPISLVPLTSSQDQETLRFTAKKEKGNKNHFTVLKGPVVKC